MTVQPKMRTAASGKPDSFSALQMQKCAKHTPFFHRVNILVGLGMYILNMYLRMDIWTVLLCNGTCIVSSNEESFRHLVRRPATKVSAQSTLCFRGAHLPADGRAWHRGNDSGLQPAEVTPPAVPLAYNSRSIHQPRYIS
jgi:hypothetical protein